MRNLQELHMRREWFTLLPQDSPPLFYAVQPSFNNLLCLEATVTLNSMDDVDVLLRIIKASEDQLRFVTLSCKDGRKFDGYSEARASSEELLRSSANNSLEYYNFNLNLTRFEMPGVSGLITLVHQLIASRSNLFTYVTSVKMLTRHLSDARDVLGSFNRLESLAIHMMRDSVSEKELVGLNSALGANSFSNLSAISLYCRYGEKVQESARGHDLERSCIARGINLVITSWDQWKY
jgi:hypothetical protein